MKNQKIEDINMMMSSTSYPWYWFATIKLTNKKLEHTF